jgi:N-acetylglucosamine kinase-like BadF-type ATPase
MTSYILGVDGGGTKTLGVIFDANGREVDRALAGFGNFSVSESDTKKHLFDVLEALYKRNPNHKIEMIQIGIAGYSNYHHKEELAKVIQERFKADVSLVTDAELALHSIKRHRNNPVIMVLGGTGSVVIYEDRDEMRMIGGFGHLLGDEGSGYHLAITALKQVINQFEERKPISPLSKSLLKEIHARDYSDIKSFVYNNQKVEIARLSEFIAKHALAGDQEAIDLFINEGDLLASQTLKAYDAMSHQEPVIIGFKGGFLLNAPYVKETLTRTLNQHQVDYQMDTSSVEPVVGAYYLAKRHMDKR